MKMVEKNGEKVPFYAADGIGKMNKGGMVKKYNMGGGVPTNAGDTFTFVAATAVGARCRITCVSDNGTGQVWMATSVGTPISTVA